MHDFARRMEQLLNSLPDLTQGHKERLQRPLKQADMACWQGLDAEIAGGMKAALRSIAHELLEACCLQLEGALTRCRSDHARLLLVALVANKLPSWTPVLFREAGRTSGIAYPSAETIVIEPQGLTAGPPTDLLVESWTGAASLLGFQAPSGDQLTKVADLAILCSDRDERAEAAPSANIVCYAAAQIRDDPFRCAAEIFERLGKRGEKP